MRLDTIKKTANGKTYTSHLLRQAYRDKGKVRHRTIANLSDMSVVARFDFGLTILTYLSVRTFLSVHAGNGELRFGIAEPIRIVAPLFEVGGALTLDF